MVAVQSAELETGRGLVGDVNHAARRAVTLIERDRWAEACEVLKAAVDPGARRANVMVSIRLSTARMLPSAITKLQIPGCQLPKPRTGPG